MSNLEEKRFTINGAGRRCEIIQLAGCVNLAKPIPEHECWSVEGSNPSATTTKQEESGMTSSFNRSEIEAHIALLHERAVGCEGGLILAGFEEGGHPQIQRFRIGDVSGMVDVIMAFEKHPRLNLYAPWCVMRADLEPSKKGSEGDVTAVLAAIEDQDNDKHQRVKVPVEPSYVIESSAGNFQPIYVFPRPIPVQEAKPALVAFSEFLGGDTGTKDCSHVWRIPGTLNYPIKSKLARGRSPEPQPVKIKKPYDGTFVDPAALLALKPKGNGQERREASSEGPPPSWTREEEGRLRLALRAVPGADDYDFRIRIGMALHSLGWGAQGLSIWEDWARKSVKFDAEEHAYKWETFDANRDGDIVTIAAIYAIAMENGWHAPPRRLHSPNRGNGADPAEGDERPPKFPLIPFEQILFDEKEEWRVKGLLPRVGFGVIYGGPASIKSFLSLDLGFHIALGWPWGGRRVEQGSVVYIAAEGSGGIAKRKTGWELYHAEALSTDPVPFYLIKVAPNLGVGEGDLNELIACIEKEGVRPALVFIDTIAQTLGGGEENGAGMVTFAENATALANYFQCLSIAIQHIPLADDQRLRGHSSLLGALDVALLSERKEGSFSATLSTKKLKDEDGDQKFTINLMRVVIAKDKDGDEISTLVVESIESGAVEGTKGAPQKAKIPPQKRLLIAVIEQLIDESETPPFKPWDDGPLVKAIPEEVVRRRYYFRMGEKAKLGEDPQKLADRQRRAFYNAVKDLLNAQLLMACQRDGERFLWLP